MSWSRPAPVAGSSSKGRCGPERSRHHDAAQFAARPRGGARAQRRARRGQAGDHPGRYELHRAFGQPGNRGQGPGKGRRHARRPRQRRRAQGRRGDAGDHGGGAAGDVRAGQGHPRQDGFFRHAGRRDRQRQRDEAGQPDHRRLEHRRDVGGDGPGHQGRRETRRRSFRRSGAAWPAARSSTPRCRWRSRAISSRAFASSCTSRTWPTPWTPPTSSASPSRLSSVVMEIMQALKADGKAANDHGGLIQFYEQLAKVQVRS